MTPELIIAIEVCLKAGKSMIGTTSPGDRVRDGESCHRLMPAYVGMEAFRLIGQSLSVTGLPVLGAYSEQVSFRVRARWRRLWLVSVTNGQSASMKRTVGVALIDDHEPVLGVIYSPATDELYCASIDAGAYRVLNASNSFVRTTKLSVQASNLPGKIRRPVRLVLEDGSMDERMLACIEELKHEYPEITIVNSPSVMSICLIATGDAELYPKIDTTCEWETAAGHAILKATGRNLVDLGTGRELTYNKPEMINPRFIAR
jgi:3'(2'), 5'-bisphosphate nucleotidase